MDATKEPVKDFIPLSKDRRQHLKDLMDNHKGYVVTFYTQEDKKIFVLCLSEDIKDAYMLSEHIWHKFVDNGSKVVKRKVD